MTSDVIKKKGEVFTPDYIAEFMSSFICNHKVYDILEPSCGNGALLEFLSSKHRVTGLDIQRRHIQHCKKHFSNHSNWSFQQQDFTKFQTKQKFDYIIANPPYVKIQNLEPGTIQRMQQEYPDFIYGNTNLFIYFIAKCMDLLKEDGQAIFIVPNTILYNKSQQRLKNYLLQHRKIKHIIDFKDTQVFENATTYTCILVLTNQPNKSYTLQTGMQGTMRRVFYGKDAITSPIARSPRLFTPRIGLMTLADDVFILKEFQTHADGTLTFQKDHKIYQIETASCLDILKVSKKAMYKIIYPYTLENGKAVINQKFEQMYPLCFAYLSEYRNRLEARDNGNTTAYPAWYAYGRTQSLIPRPSNRLFLSTIVQDISTAAFTKRAPLYYSGLYLEPSPGVKTSDIKQFLKENAKEIIDRSNHRAGGWYALSSSSFLLHGTHG